MTERVSRARLERKQALVLARPQSPCVVAGDVSAQPSEQERTVTDRVVEQIGRQSGRSRATLRRAHATLLHDGGLRIACARQCSTAQPHGTTRVHAALTFYHSADNKNWILLTSPAQYISATLVAGAVNDLQVLVETLSTTNSRLGFVRLGILCSGTTPEVDVEIYVTGRGF